MNELAETTRDFHLGMAIEGKAQPTGLPQSADEVMSSALITLSPSRAGVPRSVAWCDQAAELLTRAIEAEQAQLAQLEGDLERLQAERAERQAAADTAGIELMALIRAEQRQRFGDFLPSFIVLDAAGDESFETSQARFRWHELLAAVPGNVVTVRFNGAEVTRSEESDTAERIGQLRRLIDQHVNRLGSVVELGGQPRGPQAPRVRQYATDANGRQREIVGAPEPFVPA